MRFEVSMPFAKLIVSETRVFTLDVSNKTVMFCSTTGPNVFLYRRWSRFQANNKGRVARRAPKMFL